MCIQVNSGLEKLKAPLMINQEEHPWACSCIPAEFQKNTGVFLELYQKQESLFGSLQFWTIEKSFRRISSPQY